MDFPVGLRGSESCEWCEKDEDGQCQPDCGCGNCESERALDDDADAYFDRA